MRSRQEWLQIEGHRLVLWTKCPPTDLLLVSWLVDWFVVVGINFGFKRRKISVREEVRWAHDNGLFIFKKQVENLTKIDE